MKRSELGTSGILVSGLALGTWAYSGANVVKAGQLGSQVGGEVKMVQGKQKYGYAYYYDIYCKI